MLVASNISVVVPAYNRAQELRSLLDSVLSQTIVPLEVLVVEDMSPEREEIGAICEIYSQRFSRLGSVVECIKNESNLGFDANVRKCLSAARGKWALLLGNDDVLLPECIGEVGRFLKNFNGKVASRAFVRFEDDVSNRLGVSRLCDGDTVFRLGECSPRMIFRSGAFIGGLLFDVQFCRDNETDVYDGTLYYQIYLFSLAYCLDGIGYISTPIAGGRAGNAPMFGASDSERSVHVPGAYTAAGRAKMWSSVLEIVGDVQRRFSVDLVSDMRGELAGRQSFHVFEMNAGAGVRANVDLIRALHKIGLFFHPIPIFLSLVNILFGSGALHLYRAARKYFQG